jgi:hypothetical protein
VPDSRGADCRAKLEHGADRSAADSYTTMPKAASAASTSCAGVSTIGPRISRSAISTFTPEPRGSTTRRPSARRFSGADAWCRWERRTPREKRQLLRAVFDTPTPLKTTLPFTCALPHIHLAMIDSDMSFEGRLSAATLQRRMNIVALAQVAQNPELALSWRSNTISSPSSGREPQGEGDRRVMSF